MYKFKIVTTNSIIDAKVSNQLANMLVSTTSELDYITASMTQRERAIVVNTYIANLNIAVSGVSHAKMFDCNGNKEF